MADLIGQLCDSPLFYNPSSEISQVPVGSAQPFGRLTKNLFFSDSVTKLQILWYLIVIFWCGLTKQTKNKESVKKSRRFFDRFR